MNLLFKIYEFLRGSTLTTDPMVGDTHRDEFINKHSFDDVHRSCIKYAKQSADDDSLIINVLFADELLGLIRVDGRLKPEAKVTVYSNSRSFATNTTIMAITATGMVLRTRRGTMRENDNICYSISNGGRLELHYIDTLKNIVVGDDFGISRSCAQYFNWMEYAYNWTYSGNLLSAIHKSCALYLDEKQGT